MSLRAAPAAGPLILPQRNLRGPGPGILRRLGHHLHLGLAGLEDEKREKGS